MALIKCSECGHMVSDKATKCPKCGCPIVTENTVRHNAGMNNQQPNERPVYYDEDDDGNTNKWLYAIIALLFVILAGGGYYYYNQNKQQEEDFQQKLITDSIARDSISKVEQARQDSIEQALSAKEQKQKIERKEIVPESYKKCPDGNHPHIIDLGLPSGTKWACCNVGAYSPEDKGEYYAWGETKDKSDYSTETYQYAQGEDFDGDGKYDVSQYKNLGKSICGTKYDVALKKWGGSWRMPSERQMHELIDNCSYEWTMSNGVEGSRFTSKKNGGAIFLPGTGYMAGCSPFGNDGCYWSGTPDFDPNSNSNVCAYSFHLMSHMPWVHPAQGRNYGQCVRPVTQ